MFYEKSLHARKRQAQRGIDDIQLSILEYYGTIRQQNGKSFFLYMEEHDRKNILDAVICRLFSIAKAIKHKKRLLKKGFCNHLSEEIIETKKAYKLLKKCKKALERSGKSIIVVSQKTKLDKQCIVTVMHQYKRIHSY